MTAAPSPAPTDELLLGIWREVLGRADIGDDDEFFELGGDSILATRVMGRLRAALGVELPLRLIFFHPVLGRFSEAVAAAVVELGGPAVPALRARQPGEQVPLSPAQERLWVLDQVHPGNPAYTELLALRLTGALDPDRLVACVRGLVRRHEALRARFPCVDGRPRQEIAAEVDVPVERVDLSGAGDLPTRERRARELGMRHGARPFDLAGGPLVRAVLIRLAERDHVLLLFVHHIVADGWSLDLLRDELAAAYGETGQPATQPPPLQYGDYALWQRHQAEQGAFDGDLAFWRSRLAGVEPLDLPTDRPRPAVQSPAGARHRFRIDRATRDALAAAAAAEGATLFMGLLAAFHVVLARHAGAQQVAVGSPVAGRNLPDLEPMVGFFVNTVVLRADLSDDPTVADLLARTRDEALECYAHAGAPFARVVQEIAPERDPSRSPLFQAMLILQPAPVTAPSAFGELRAVPFDVPRRHSQFDLTLVVWDGSDDRDGHGGLELELEYATALWDAATAERVARHYARCVAAFGADQAQRVSTVDLLGSEEREWLLGARNDTDLPYPAVLATPALVAERARRAPERVALVDASGELRYAELDRRARILAGRLRAAGVGPDVVTGVCLPRSADLVVALLAVWYAGGAYLPLDPAYPPRRLRYMLADSGARVLLAGGDAAVPDPPDGCPVLDPALDPGLGPPAEPAAPDPEHLAYVIYTSGSTGTPNGVAITHRALGNFLAAMGEELRVGPDDRMLALTSVSFDIAGMEMWLPLVCGARVVVAGREEATDPELLLDTVHRERVGIVQATPSTWQMLVEAPRGLPPDLRAVSGGEPLVAATARALCGGAAAVWNLYGPTETTVWSTGARLHADDATVTVGGPIANTRVYLLDPGLNPVPVGVVGELYLAGAGLARGYLGRPGLTADRFVPDPFRPGRMYRTGDVARWRDDGRIELLGRRDHQVKLHGHRIEVGEVESRLAEHPAVARAAVALREDRGSPRLVAYLVGRPPPAAELRAFLGQALPDYMVPTGYVVLPELPRTPNGKLDRRALPAPPAERAAGDEYLPPEGERERDLARIWAEVLGVERVGRTDNFFDLGGDSVLAIQVTTRARRRGLAFAVADLFRHQSVAALAEVRGTGVEEPAVVQPLPEPPPPQRLGYDPAELADAFPLSSLQRRMLRAGVRAPRAGRYVVPAEALLDGDLDQRALRRAWQLLVDRHPILRTALHHTGLPEPVQAVRRDVRAPFHSEDWRGLTAEQQRRRRAERLDAEWTAGFATDAAPLARLSLARLGERRHSLVLTRHNAILDGWSFAQLFDELCELHAALRDGRPVPERPESPSMREFVAWTRGRDIDAAGRLRDGFLHGLRPALLFDPAPAAHGPASYRETRIDVPATLDTGVQRWARVHRCTPATLVEGAWALVLGRHTATADVVYGVTQSTRPAQVPGVETTLGLLINMPPTGARIDAAARLSDWFAAVGERSAALREVAHAALDEVGHEYDTLLLLHNYPHSFDDAELPGGLRLLDTRGFSRFDVPLAVSVDLRPLRVALFFDEARVGAAAAATLGRDLVDTVTRVVSEVSEVSAAAARVGDLLS